MRNQFCWYVRLVERDEQKRGPHPRARLAFAGVWLVGGLGFLLMGMTSRTSALLPGVMFLLNVPIQVWRSSRDAMRARDTRKSS